MEVTAVERPSFSENLYPFRRAAMFEDDDHADGTEVAMDIDSVSCAFALLEYARSARPVLHADVQYWLHLFGVQGELDSFTTTSSDCSSTSPSTTDSFAHLTTNHFEVNAESLRYSAGSNEPNKDGMSAYNAEPTSRASAIRHLLDIIHLDHSYDGRFHNGVSPDVLDTHPAADSVRGLSGASAVSFGIDGRPSHMPTGGGAMVEHRRGRVTRVRGRRGRGGGAAAVNDCMARDKSIEIYNELKEQGMFPDVIPVAFRDGIGSYGCGTVRPRGGVGSRGTRGVRGIHRSRGSSGSRGGGAPRGGLGSRGGRGGLGTRGKRFVALFATLDEPPKMKRKLNARQPRRDHSDAGVTHACLRCRKSFSKRHYLLRHMRRMHPPINQRGSNNDNADPLQSDDESNLWGEEIGQTDDEFYEENEERKKCGSRLAGADLERLETVQEGGEEMEEGEEYVHESGLVYENRQSRERNDFIDSENAVLHQELSIATNATCSESSCETKTSKAIQYSPSISVATSADPNISGASQARTAASEENYFLRNRWGDAENSASSDDDTMSDDSNDERGLVIDWGENNHSNEGACERKRHSAESSANVASSSYLSASVESSVVVTDAGIARSHRFNDECGPRQSKSPSGHSGEDDRLSAVQFASEDSLPWSSLPADNDLLRMQSRVVRLNAASHDAPLSLASAKAATSTIGTVEQS